MFSYAPKKLTALIVSVTIYTETGIYCNNLSAIVINDNLLPIIMLKIWNEKFTVTEGDRKVSLRSTSQQPPVILCQM